MDFLALTLGVGLSSDTAGSSLSGISSASDSSSSLSLAYQKTIYQLEFIQDVLETNRTVILVWYREIKGARIALYLVRCRQLVPTRLEDERENTIDAEDEDDSKKGTGHDGSHGKEDVN